MALMLDIGFRIRWIPAVGRRVCFMSDWVKESAAKLRAQNEAQAKESAAQLQREKLRQEQGPRLWNEVREHARVKCAELNRELGEEALTFSVVQNSQLLVQFKAPTGKVHELKATFDPSSADNALHWNTTGHRMNETQNGKCELSIKNDVVSFLTGAHPYTAESIAEKMLTDLLLP